MVVLYLLSRCGFYLAGVRLNPIGVEGHQYPQQVDLALLKSHFVQSIWYLQSQPPLYNVASGLLVRLPLWWRQPTVCIVMLGLGILLVLACHQLGLDLGFPGWLAAAVAVLVILDPAYVLYENLFFYTYPTAVLLTVSALAATRYALTRKRLWLVVLVVCPAGVVLINSTFQWPWLLLVLAPVGYLYRARWRSIAVVALLPLILVAGWYVKDAVLFSTASSSSWLGMNLEKITTAQLPEGEIKPLVAKGNLTPISELRAFFVGISAYVPRYSNHPSTGVPVLDEVTKSDGTPNFNNINIISVARQYQRNDLSYIETRPVSYASSVGDAVTLFLVPSDQYFICWPDGGQYITTYTRGFDLVAAGQIFGTSTQTMWKDANLSSAPSPKHISLVAILEILATVFVLPAIAWRRRRQPAVSLPLFFISITAVYVMVVTNFIELGENNRFRFDLGPLPLIALVFVVVAASRHVGSRKLHTAVTGGAGQ